MAKMTDPRFPVGTRVVSVEFGTGTVLRHGRDSSNVYTEVQFDSGIKVRVHRSSIKREIERP